MGFKNQRNVFFLLGLALLLTACGAGHDFANSEETPALQGAANSPRPEMQLRDSGGTGRWGTLTYGLSNDATLSVGNLTSDVYFQLKYTNGNLSSFYVSPNGSGTASYYLVGVNSIDWIKMTVAGNAYDKIDFVSGGIDFSGADPSAGTANLSYLHQDNSTTSDAVQLSNQTWSHSETISDLKEVTISY